MPGDWLLCDFHIHTRFSDGVLSPAEVVDLFGNAGFDVIAITDHVLDAKTVSSCLARSYDPGRVSGLTFANYLDTLQQETRRAWQQYKMLVITGLELTNGPGDYHILGLDLAEFISADQTVPAIVADIHRQGGLAIAPHPHRGALRNTGELMHLWNHRQEYAGLFDAWEIANRDDLFHVVSREGYPFIANSDFHDPPNLYSWKTLLRCEKTIPAVKAAIRANRDVAIHLFRQKACNQNLEFDGLWQLL